jgi:hypothetical protein
VNIGAPFSAAANPASTGAEMVHWRGWCPRPRSRPFDPNAAIKQGWGQDDDDWTASSDFNSTGFVNGDRYAVAILLTGPS